MTPERLHQLAEALELAERVLTEDLDSASAMERLVDPDAAVAHHILKRTLLRAFRSLAPEVRNESLAAACRETLSPAISHGE